MRARVIGSLIIGALIAFTAMGTHMRVAAQDMTTAGHTLVGTWMADSNLEDDLGELDVFIFGSDGTYIESSANGDVALGAWEATGENTANLIYIDHELHTDGSSLGSLTIRAQIEVAADGNTFTAVYTVEYTDASGVASGQAGPGMATGTRLQVEAMGEPVMTFDELFGAFEGEPQATPIS